MIIKQRIFKHTLTPTLIFVSPPAAVCVLTNSDGAKGDFLFVRTQTRATGQTTFNTINPAAVCVLTNSDGVKGDFLFVRTQTRATEEHRTIHHHTSLAAVCVLTNSNGAKGDFLFVRTQTRATGEYRTIHHHTSPAVCVLTNSNGAKGDFLFVRTQTRATGKQHSTQLITMELNKMYFYTATILKWQKLLKPDKYKDIVINSLHFLSSKGKIQIHAFVIMPNHIHLIWTILAMNGKEMPNASFMKFTGHEFLRDLRENHPSVLPFFESTENSRTYHFWERESLAVELYSR